LSASDQRLAAVDVEVVGRLVEDQQMRSVEGREADQQPRLLAARQILRLACSCGRPAGPIGATRARTFDSGASGISLRTWATAAARRG
jgi:hypothetical protein